MHHNAPCFVPLTLNSLCCVSPFCFNLLSSYLIPLTLPTLFSTPHNIYVAQKVLLWSHLASAPSSIHLPACEKKCLWLYYNGIITCEVNWNPDRCISYGVMTWCIAVSQWRLSYQRNRSICNYLQYSLFLILYGGPKYSLKYQPFKCVCTHITNINKTLISHTWLQIPCRKSKTWFLEFTRVTRSWVLFLVMQISANIFSSFLFLWS